MAAIGIGGVEKPQAMIMSVKQKVGQPLYAERSLVRMMTLPTVPGAHCETTGW